MPVLDVELRPREVSRDRAPDRGGRPPAPPGRHDGNGDGEPPASSEGLPLSNARLGMLMLLGGEAMFFGGLIIAFLQLRLGAAAWPPPGQPRLPIGLTALNTVILLASSWTLVRALRAVRAGDRTRARALARVDVGARRPLPGHPGRRVDAPRALRAPGVVGDLRRHVLHADRRARRPRARRGRLAGRACSGSPGGGGSRSTGTWRSSAARSTGISSWPSGRSCTCSSTSYDRREGERNRERRSSRAAPSGRRAGRVAPDAGELGQARDVDLPGRRRRGIRRAPGLLRRLAGRQRRLAEPGRRCSASSSPP